VPSDEIEDCAQYFQRELLSIWEGLGYRLIQQVPQRIRARNDKRRAEMGITLETEINDAIQPMLSLFEEFLDVLEASNEGRQILEASNDLLNDIMARMLSARARVEELQASYSEAECSLLREVMGNAFLGPAQRAMRSLDAVAAIALEDTDDPTSVLLLQLVQAVAQIGANALDETELEN